jgi:hypothetical protein
MRVGRTSSGVVGLRWSEPKLPALPADFEARTKARTEPRFLPTAVVP